MTFYVHITLCYSEMFYKSRHVSSYVVNADHDSIPGLPVTNDVYKRELRAVPIVFPRQIIVPTPPNPDLSEVEAGGGCPKLPASKKCLTADSVNSGEIEYPANTSKHRGII
ncbi:hypothetical protein BKA82DRAFT_382840 [Pisolithus tinctorius]|uniref:Uncharacterized protein n=1 Tax=Pisolithus tinctorius Marx 270 TaxID=870435 RepID=A0A0C3NFG2_PISTI|nr:hypothetical protein BKA82DRAFT_382840 [Pisolithus tinctorius]KIN94510.1 hypothetical protein M404DRAFT_382840 [Pisolithus tinctorius Marx 270]